MVSLNYDSLLIKYIVPQYEVTLNSVFYRWAYQELQPTYFHYLYYSLTQI